MLENKQTYQNALVPPFLCIVVMIKIQIQSITFVSTFSATFGQLGILLKRSPGCLQLYGRYTILCKKMLNWAVDSQVHLHNRRHLLTAICIWQSKICTEQGSGWLGARPLM